MENPKKFYTLFLSFGVSFGEGIFWLAGWQDLRKEKACELYDT